VLTVDVRWSMKPEEMADLDPGAPRRDRAISEACELASRVGCNVNLLYPGRSYQVGPESTLQSVLERYGEGPGVAVFRPDSKGYHPPEWIGQPAEGYKGETARLWDKGTL
jgi:hypothetical protein